MGGARSCGAVVSPLRTSVDIRFLFFASSRLHMLKESQGCETSSEWTEWMRQPERSVLLRTLALCLPS